MLQDLFRNRARPPFGSLPWLKAWTKRVLLMPLFVKQWRYHTRLRRRGARVHATAFFSDATLINGGAVGECEVGEESFVGRAELAAHAAIRIGRRACINDGVRVLTASHDLSDPAWKSFAKPIIIKDYAWVATDAILLPGVTIGTGAVVGAGAVVSKDVPDFSIAAGNPARLLEKRRVEPLNYSPTRNLALFEAWLGKPSHPAGNTKTSCCKPDIHE